MNNLSSYNPRYIELGIIAFLLIIVSFFSFSAGVLISLGYIWNWTLRFEIEKVNSNKRYKYSTLRLVFTFDRMIKKISGQNTLLTAILRILPIGLFWFVVCWFLGTSDFVWAPFVGSAFYEMTNYLLEKFLAKKCE